VGEQSQLPEAVQRLILERLHSVEELEALLLVHSDAARAWTVKDVSTALRINVTMANSALASLAARQLCVTMQDPEPAVKLDQRDPALIAAVAELAQSYEQQRVEILVFISRAAITRVRNGALHTFAEAFRISGRKKDG
jgi:hypothetical protein